MKAIKIMILSLLAGWVWGACDDEKVEEIVLAPELEVQASVNCDWKGTPVSVPVKTNQTVWMASVSEDAQGWCEFVPRRDSIILKLAENMLETERRTEIVVMAGGLSDTLKVVQEAGAQPYCRVTETELKFIWHENSLETEVLTNQTSWTPELKNAGWCSMKVVGNQIKITAERNDGTNPRSGQLIITAGRAEPLVVPLSQEGKQTAVSGVVAFRIPSNFTVSEVCDVWNGDVKVAEICREYVPAVNDKAGIVVVYPWVDAKPDLANGLVVADGGRLDWSSGSAVYTRGMAAKALETVGWDGNRFLTEVSADVPLISVFQSQFKDVEGNYYRIVKIGTQYWLGDNLRTTKYADGGRIGEDYTTQEGAWSQFEDIVSGKLNKEVAGLLYNWYVLPRIASQGWHVPSVQEWEVLQGYLGSQDAVLMRKTGAWGTSSSASDLSGFSAVPGGLRWDTGKFQTGSGAETALWWATDEDEKDNKKAYYISIEFNQDQTQWNSYLKNYSYSVRLLRD